MRKDFLGEIIGEQKMFLVIQGIILTIIIALLLLNIGNLGSNEEKKIAICGDGVLDKGESFETCCLDAGCQDGLSCLKETEETFTCQLLTKEDTIAFQDFEKLGNTLLEQAYNFENAKKEIEISRSLMRTSIDDLNEKGFNTDAEEESYNIITSHLDTIQQINTLNKQSEEFALDPDFLEVFYLDSGDPREVKQELIVMQNTSAQSMELISTFQNKIINITENTKNMLTNLFELNTQTMIEDYNLLFEGFNETNIKATTLLSKI